MRRLDGAVYWVFIIVACWVAAWLIVWAGYAIGSAL